MRIIRAGEHIQHIPGYGISVRESGVAVAEHWWEVAGKTCVAAYQPKGAASYAASKVNLANPGTYDATDGAAYPTWSAATGWTFNGTTQYLATGVVPAQGWSLVGQIAAGGNNTVMGESVGGRIGIRTFDSGNRYYMGSVSYGTGGRNSGNVAVCGAQGYWNGAADGDSIVWSNHAPVALYIGADNTSGTAAYFFAGTVIALAFYSDTLSAAETAVLAEAMAAL